MRRIRRAAHHGLAVGCPAVALVVTLPLGAVATPTPAVAPASSVSRLAGTPVTAAARVPRDVRLIRVRTSLLATHYWYRQVHDGVPVRGGFYVRHVYRDGHVEIVDHRRPVSGLADTTPAVGTGTAALASARPSSRAARAREGQAAPLSGPITLAILPGGPSDGDTGRSRLVWVVTRASGSGVTQSYVDAHSGDLVHTVQLAQEKVARGRVFVPNPVVRLQRPDLRDHRDSADAVPSRAYTRRLLRHLQRRSTRLHGRYVRIVGVPVPAESSQQRFVYTRDDDRFEQVEAYWAIDRAQTYLHRLGFTDANNQPQQVTTDAFADDNSYYNPRVDRISFGTGGVDDAEDAEVVWHEYGHAIQADQVPGFGATEQGRAMGEGFGDYLAYTMSQPSSPDTATTPLACIADWDATTYDRRPPHCLRRVDRRKTYPDDMQGEVHADGEIWSRALRDINLGLGRHRANRLVIEAQFRESPVTRFRGAATITVRTARMLYGDRAAAVTRRAFVRRGILPVSN